MGAFYNNASSDIVGFNQISSNEFRSDGELVERSTGGTVSKTTFTLKYVPETAVGVSLNLQLIRNPYEGYSNMYVYTLNSSYSCHVLARHEWANNAGSCDLNLKKSNPQTIEHLITNGGGGGVNEAIMSTKSYIDDLSSY